MEKRCKTCRYYLLSGDFGPKYTPESKRYRICNNPDGPMYVTASEAKTIVANGKQTQKKRRNEIMSMYYAGYFGTALKLNTEEFTSFLERYREIAAEDEAINFEYKDFDEDSLDLSDIGFIWGADLCLPVRREFKVARISPDQCDGMMFSPYSSSEGQTFLYEDPDDLRGEDSFLIFSEGQPLKPYGKPYYKSYLDLVREFKDKAEAYLPKDFDWEKHIGLFRYAAFA